MLRAPFFARKPLPASLVLTAAWLCSGETCWPQQSVRILNNVNQCAAAAVIVWRSAARPDGYELGMELKDPPPDFWGLEL